MNRKSKAGVLLLIFGGSLLPAAGPAGAQNSLLGQKPATTTAATFIAEHQRLAEHYRAEAQECHRKLVKQEALVNHWAGMLWMQSRLKLPNPYSSARTLVDVYRARTEKWTRLAAEQEQIVKQASRKP
jgi:hypothetical protein